MPPAREFLLAGGSGFIGTHVARGLLAAGHGVTVLSRGRRAVVPGAGIVTGDRTRPESVVAALDGRRFDVTVDFLAYDAPDLDWLAHVPPGSAGRCVMISTGQVYLVGEGGAMPFVEAEASRPARAEPTTGDHDRASWRYGVGKRRAEQALLDLGRRHGAPAVALRLPIVQGEGDASLRLWAYLERILDGRPVLLPEGGRRPVRHLYAGDLAPILDRIARGPEPAHVAYNLAQPDVAPLRALLERVAAAAGAELRIVEASWEACRGAGLDERFSPYGGTWSSVLDPSRAAAELGFIGTASADYLPRLVRRLLEHRPAESHEGYAQREREVGLAAALA